MAEATVTPVNHRALGGMLRMTVSPNLSLDLTIQEAQTLSRAVSALARDRTLTHDIYLSPLASDGDFCARATDQGLEIDVDGGVCTLSWPAAASLALQLAGE